MCFLFTSCNDKDIYLEKTVYIRAFNDKMFFNDKLLTIEALDNQLQKLTRKAIITVNINMSDDVSYERMMYF